MKKIHVFKFLMWILISGSTGLFFQAPPLGGTIKDTESSCHADTAAIPVRLKTYDFPGVKIVQFNLAVLSRYSDMVVSKNMAMVADPARDIGAYVDVRLPNEWVFAAESSPGLWPASPMVAHPGRPFSGAHCC